MRTCLIGCLLLALTACASAHSAPLPAGPKLSAPVATLPDLTTLDALTSRRPSDLLEQPIDVTAPLLSSNTTEVGGNLRLGPASQAWAVYRVPSTGLTPVQLSVVGSGVLWVLVADYSTGEWHTEGTVENTGVPFDYDAVGNPVSPSDFAYVAILAEPEQSPELQHLTLLGDDGGAAWNIAIGADASAVEVDWRDLGADSYRILRTTVPSDSSPYVVGTVAGHAPGNPVDCHFFDPIPAYTDGSWEPQINDNGTPADPSDDFPSAAPGVVSYYKIVPVTAGIDGPPSQYHASFVPWGIGSRRTTRRPLPDTTSTTRVFADQLNVAGMTAQQNQFCATHFVGTQKIVKRRADELRAFNPDFLVLGYHLGTGAGNIGNAAGNDWDDDADWPYVDRHESWFHHLPDSLEPNQRVDQSDYHWKVMDPDSQWADYLSGNMLEMLGEDHFDGWFLDSTSEMWNTSPAQWWSGPSMFGFWTPKLDSMLATVNARMQAHPLQPYVIPNAGAYITTASDIKYYGCDGIMIEGYAHNSPGSYFALADWQLELDRILDHQAHGVATILQGYIDSANTNDRLFLYGSYLLVRGPKTYINWLASDMDSGIGQWYPEWDVSFGAPVSGQPLSVAAMALPNGLYRRDFAQGIVVVNPTDTAQLFTPDASYKVLTPMGGGNIDAAGTPPGTAAWLPLPGAASVQPHQALILKK